MPGEDKKLKGSVEIKVQKSIAEIRSLRTEMRKMQRAADRSTQKAGRGVEKLGNKTAKTSQQMKGLKASSLLAAVGIGSLVFAMTKLAKTTVTTFANFDKAGARLRAISGIIGKQSKEYQNMEALVKRMGRTTQFTATQSADALKVLKQAGLETAQAMDTLEATLAIAVGTGEEIVSTAEAMAGVMNSFNLAGSESSRVADVMASSFSNTNLNLERFREAMKFAGTSANLVGVNLEQTTAALGVLANNMITGTRAGTEMNRLFIELNDTTSRIVKSLGGASLQTHSLQQLLEIAKEKSIGFNKAMAEIGIRGGRAFNVLLKNTDQLKELEEAFVGATGEAARMREEMEKTLSGEFKKLESAWESLMIEMGEGVDSFLSDTIRGFTNLISKVSLGMNNLKWGIANEKEISKLFTENAEAVERIGKIVGELPSGINSINPNLEKSKKLWEDIVKSGDITLLQSSKRGKAARSEVSAAIKFVFEQVEAQKQIEKIERQILGLKFQNDVILPKRAVDSANEELRKASQLNDVFEKLAGTKKALGIVEKARQDIFGREEKMAEIAAEKASQKDKEDEKAIKAEVRRKKEASSILEGLENERLNSELALEQQKIADEFQMKNEATAIQQAQEELAADDKFAREKIKSNEQLDAKKLEEEEFSQAIATIFQTRTNELDRIDREGKARQQERQEKLFKSRQKIWNEEAKFYGETLGQMVAADAEAMDQLTAQFVNHVLSAIQAASIKAVASAIATEVGTKGLAGLITGAIATGAISAAFSALKGQVSAGITGKAAGGLTGGEGGSREDENLIRVSPNEYMIDAETVRRKGLQSVKQYHRGFADGGPTTNDHRSFNVTQNFPTDMSRDFVLDTVKESFTYGEFRDIGRIGGFN